MVNFTSTSDSLFGYLSLSLNIYFKQFDAGALILFMDYVSHTHSQLYIHILHNLVLVTMQRERREMLEELRQENDFESKHSESTRGWEW